MILIKNKSVFDKFDKIRNHLAVYKADYRAEDCIIIYFRMEVDFI
jgi:hypothetical protein